MWGWGVGCGEELPRGAGSAGRKEEGPRSEEGADHELTPSCLFHDSPHNLA